MTSRKKTPKQKALIALHCLKEDFEMLLDGRWEPDADSIEASLECVAEIQDYFDLMEK